MLFFNSVRSRFASHTTFWGGGSMWGAEPEAHWVEHPSCADVRGCYNYAHDFPHGTQQHLEGLRFPIPGVFSAVTSCPAGRNSTDAVAASARHRGWATVPPVDCLPVPQLLKAQNSVWDEQWRLLRAALLWVQKVSSSFPGISKPG